MSTVRPSARRRRRRKLTSFSIRPTPSSLISPLAVTFPIAIRIFRETRSADNNIIIIHVAVAAAVPMIDGRYGAPAFASRQ